LSTAYRILSSILLSRLTPYAEEILGDHQCGFRSGRSAVDNTSCIRQILEKKWKYNEAVRQLFIDLKKPVISVKKEVLYNTLIQFAITMNLVRIIKMCLNETYGRARVCKHLTYFLLRMV
jgi:hypothetical protein